MFCRKCGNRLLNQDTFCPTCGEPTGMVPACENANVNTSVKQETKIEKEKAAGKGLSKLNIFLIATATAAIILMVLMFVGIIPSIKNTQGGNAGKVEGNGYDTPEDALKAHVKALNNGDINEVISTYAVESYVDNFDTKAFLERMNIYSPMFPVSYALELSDGGEFDRDIRIKVREAIIIRDYYQMVDLYTVDHHDNVISFSDDGDVDTFLKDIQKSDFLNDWKNMKFIEIVDPEDVCDAIYRDKSIENLKRYKKQYCCEDIAEVCALVEIDGDEYYQLAECGMYDGKWYIITCKGMLSLYLGASSGQNGLVPVDD